MEGRRSGAVVGSEKQDDRVTYEVYKRWRTTKDTDP
jgi:hypothetical protein